MNHDEVYIPISKVLGDSTSQIEKLYQSTMLASPARQYIFDMQAVSWIKPYGALALVLSARHLAQRTDQSVLVQNIREDVHLYLNRMNILDNDYGWLQSTSKLSEEWFRNPQTPNLLELTVIRSAKDVEALLIRARHIFDHWLSSSDLHALLQVLSEVCSNIYQHSSDSYGCVLIQAYKFPQLGTRKVCLAVGDLGCGVRNSLAQKYGEVGNDPLDYLMKAVRGVSSRHSGRGGLGLQTIRRLAHQSGGNFWLRSETAGIFSSNTSERETRGLVHVPGTQLAIELSAPLI